MFILGKVWYSSGESIISTAIFSRYACRERESCLVALTQFMKHTNLKRNQIIQSQHDFKI